MFSALKMKSPNATICFMSSKIRSIKNGTVDYLDEMVTERQHAVGRFAIKHGRKTRTMKRLQQSAINDELARPVRACVSNDNMAGDTSRNVTARTTGAIEFLRQNQTLSTHKVM